MELTEACLKRIEKYNPAVNAFITVTRESALATRGQWRRRHGGANGEDRLHGIPIAIKDNIDTAGVRTTGASELFKDRIPNGRCRSGPQAEERRCDYFGQAQYARVRLRPNLRGHLLRAGAQSLGAGSDFRGIVRRFRRRHRVPTFASARSARTPADRSGSLAPTAVRWA